MTRGRDLARARAGGRRVRGRALDLCVGPSEAGTSRVGIVVPRHGHTAVARNRVKRRLREIVRIERIGDRRTPPADLVVIARPLAYEASFARLRGELLGLYSRAGQ